MTSSNRTQMAMVRETTLGTTPNTPRMRNMRFTGESLAFTPLYVDPAEIRQDRMNVDPIRVMQSSAGGIQFELTFPDDNSPLSEIYRSAFYNPWSNTPLRDNDGAAASVITNVNTTGGVVTVTNVNGTFVTGHLVRNTGFGQAANNGIFKCTTGSATVPGFTGQGLVNEASPAAAARMKVVGIAGAAADITATAGGLASTLLDFTTFPELVIGKWIKVGGTAAGDKFATAVLNDWARIIGVTATTITLDNKPAGWTTDAGTGKTIKIWFGDQIKNGTTQSSLTIERGFLGQTVPTYIVNRGMVVNTLDHTINSKAKITGAVAFQGMDGAQSTATLDAATDPQTTGQIIAANANVGRLAEAGSTLTSPNWGKDLSFQLNNNLREIDAVDQGSPVSVREGDFGVTGKINTYFGDNTLLAKFYSGAVTALNARVAKNGQALVWQFPRVTLRGGGNPQASAKNTDVMANFDFAASIDTVTNAQAILDRLEYFET